MSLGKPKNGKYVDAQPEPNRDKAKFSKHSVFVFLIIIKKFYDLKFGVKDALNLTE